MAQTHAEILQAIKESQHNHELSIIKISKPISTVITNAQTASRTSDVSVQSFEAPTPSSLQVDLTHYKELFSKLRFLYVEQVTKEKFIRSIVSEPPQIISHAENVALEADLTVTKSQLKAQKLEVADTILELERLGRELVAKYESVQTQTVQLEELPGKIEHLEASIVELKEKQKPGPNPLFNMTLEKTLEAVREKELESAQLDKQLEQLQAALPRKTRELERAEAELQPLEIRRLGSTASAREAQKRKEVMLGGTRDDLEERGRWWRGVERGLKGMLEIES